MGGDLRDERHIRAVVGQRDGHVRLAAAIDGGECVGLHEAGVMGGGRAQDDLAKGDNAFHGISLRL